MIRIHTTVPRPLLIGILFISTLFSAVLIIVFFLRVEDVTFSSFTLPQFERQLDGVSVRTKDSTDLRPVAIMVDNHIDARPTEGLDSASIVFETIAEGQITRFLAIFDPAEIPERVGPVRSLRPYFLDWAEEFHAVIAHVGGSPEALERTKSDDTIDEFREGGITFWRDSSRFAPHDTFTSREKLLASIENNQFVTTSTNVVFTYEDTPIFGISAGDVKINFSIGTYNVEWKLNTENGRYERFVDSASESIFADNVVVLEMNARVIDEIGRRDVKTVGTGRMWYLRDGQMIVGTWENEKDTPLTLKDENTTPILFKRGVTWVSVIDDEGRVRFSNF